jgi:hypothetical protein
MDTRATLVDVATRVLAATDAGATDLEWPIAVTAPATRARGPRAPRRSAARPAPPRVHAVGS